MWWSQNTPIPLIYGHSHTATALIEPIVEASSASSSNPHLTASV